MNLFERFWKTVDATRDSRAGHAPDFDIVFTPVHAPHGVQSDAARDLTAITKRAPRRFPPMVVTQQAFSPRPFCLIYTVSGTQLPQFHQLFEEYVDKNAFITETFLRLAPHYNLPYVLFIGERSFFLYDAGTEELLRWGTDFGPLDELFVQPYMSNQGVERFWDGITRKTFEQRCEEFCRWLDLWKAQVGARTTVTPQFMQTLMQKVILLYLYECEFGLSGEDMCLRENFLEQRENAILSRRKKESARPRIPFDGVAWFHQACCEMAERYRLDFLKWNQGESTFFALMGADARMQFSLFILELFLLSRSKFAVQVQAHVFSDPDSRLKLWKFSVTEILNIKRRLQADDVNVYEPVWIDLEESGIGWALHVVEETLQYWRERCNYFAQQLAERKSLKVQFDMFQQPDLERAKVPLPEHVFETTFSTSVKIYYDYPLERATLEYLIILRSFEFCKQWKLPMQPLGCMSDMFVRKERIQSIQEL